MSTYLVWYIFNSIVTEIQYDRAFCIFQVGRHFAQGVMAKVYDGQILHSEDVVRDPRRLHLNSQ